jgi:shikimate dehydrogenase
MQESKKCYGLIGKDIRYSFSKKYFEEKFSDPLFNNCMYQNFYIQKIEDFPTIIKENPNLKGLSVTIPYKETIIPYLNSLSKRATEISAVNCIRFKKNGTLKGYNTDWYGFKKSLEKILQPHHKKALILGTGGAAKAIAYALEQLDIYYTYVSRQASEKTITYKQLNETTFDNFQIIINCTPLGTSPAIDEFPPIPYEFFTKNHIAFDLIYNPEQTEFLKRAKKKGATIKNGYEMLIFQAEKAWKIWNKQAL